MGSNLKNLANLAKQRMKVGNYDISTKRTIKSNGYFLKNLSALKRFNYTTEFVTITNNEDDAFLNKVYNILSSEEDIYNPIGRLVDNDYFKTLNEIEKQRYILKLCERYNRVKDNFENNKNFKRKTG